MMRNLLAAIVGMMLLSGPVLAQPPAPSPTPPPAETPAPTPPPSWVPPPLAVPGPSTPIPGASPIAHGEVLHLDLTEALRIALINSPDLASDQAAVQLRRDQLEEVLAGGRLRAELDATYTRQEPPVTVSFQGISIPFIVENNYQISLAVRQALYTFGRLHWQAAAARLGVVASEQDYRTTAERVVQQVSEAYFQVLLADENVSIAESNVALRQAHVQDAEKLYKAGTVARYDVLRDQSAETQAREELSTAQNNRDLARTALLSVIGLPPDQPVVLTAAPAPVPPPTSHDAAVQEAMNRRPELSSLQLAVSSAEANLYWRQAGLRPSFNFDSTYRSFNQVGLLPTSNQWTTDITLAIPLFDGGLTHAQIDEARQTIVQLRSNLENARRAVLQDVESAWVSLSNTWQRLQLAHQNVQETQQVVNVAEIRYRGGISTNIERLDAENTLDLARSAEAAARYDYLQAEARWQRAIGEDVTATLPGGPTTPPVPALTPPPPPPAPVPPAKIPPPPNPSTKPPPLPARSETAAP